MLIVQAGEIVEPPLTLIGDMKMTIYDIVKKLVGEISPAGASHIDGERFKNLEVMTTLAQLLITDIEEVAKLKDRHEHSIKQAGEFAHKFLTEELLIEE